MTSKGGFLVGLILGVLVGVGGMFIRYGQAEVGTARDLAVLTGKVELMAKFCPESLLKSGLVKQEGKK